MENKMKLIDLTESYYNSSEKCSIFSLIFLKETTAPSLKKYIF